MQLSQKFRPNTWKRVCGHDRPLEILLRIRDTTGFSGKAFWFHGPSGSGKTTLANLIALDVSDSLNVLEIDASDATPAKLDQVEKDCRSLAIGEKPGRAVIINESHGLRKDAIRKLLVILERIPRHVVWIFTTTDLGQLSFDGIDASPLLSRCIVIKLVPDMEAFAKRARKIAEGVGLGGADPEEYLKLATDCKGNLRMMLSEIEAGAMMRTAKPKAKREARDVPQSLELQTVTSWT